jgi:hypothetical protein
VRRAQDDVLRIVVGDALLDRGESVRSLDCGLNPVVSTLQMRLEQLEHEPVALVEVIASAREDEHTGLRAGRPETDVDPVVETLTPIHLVPDRRTPQLTLGCEVRDLAHRRPVVRPLPVAADGVRVAQPPVTVAVIVAARVGASVAVRPP